MKEIKEIKVINLTPHEIKVVMGGAEKLFPASGDVARVNVTDRLIGAIDGIPVMKQEYGDVTGLPKQQEGVYYIVSLPVRVALPSRSDLISPDTGKGGIRDRNGLIVGTQNWAV